MSLVTTAIIAAHLRIVLPGDDDTAQLQRFIDASEALCTQYLDRYVYLDAPTQLAAQAAMPATFQAAYTAWSAVYTAFSVPLPVNYPNRTPRRYDWDRYDQADAYGSGSDLWGWGNSIQLDPVQRMQLRAADEVYRDAYRNAERTFQSGVYQVGTPTPVTTPLGAAFTHAVCLLCSHYDVNREAVNTETSSAIRVPMGVEDLLMPHRRNVGVGR